ncbi:MAG TPA: M13 family metallopeptidase [Vicinamibacterales bacterium]|jgi:endothelin-converting enzyme/putative endopeptidase|nr:M13 family metallopeptidase [Vicinamibacterales bacterium]
MTRRTGRRLVAFTFVALPLAATLTWAQTAATPPTPSASGLDITPNRTLDPCNDFFAYACGEWVAKNPIPADRPGWGRFNELQDRNNDVMRAILEEAAATPTDATRKIGDYYASCMDEATIERLGVTPLAPLYRRIESIRSAGDLPPLIADLHAIGVNVFFGFGSEPDPDDARNSIAYVSQAGLGLPERDYYFREDPRSVDLRKQYEKHISDLMALSGLPAAAAAAAGARVHVLESSLATGSSDVVTLRDPVKNYHRMTVEKLQSLTPAFNWAQYFRATGAPQIRTLDVGQPDFFQKLNAVLTTTPINDIRMYLRWQVTRSASPLMSSALVNENFSFYGKTLQGAQELRARWRRCVGSTDGSLGESLGQAFVARTFGAQAKADTLAMVKAIEAALERDIDQLDWMTPATKPRALEKLHAVANKIGYPDRWKNYDSLRIVRGDALGNRQRAIQFEWRRDLDRIGKPVDRTEWFMTPPTVNAYYDPSQNNINFPAGILQPPFYRAGGDDAVNFGAIGMVVGHELTHGFDDQGRQFDGNGNLKDWWTPEDAKAFESRAACLVDQYSGYTAVDEVKLNGKLTLGENTADNGGVRLALAAYLASHTTPEPPRDGFTAEQRFFLGFAQVWCDSRRPEFERVLAQSDPHSPARYRVNGVVSNMPEFQKAFSCRADAPMVKPQACRVW